MVDEEVIGWKGHGELLGLCHALLLDLGAGLTWLLTYEVILYAMFT